MPEVSGRIETLKCNKCGNEICKFTFSGDTDMATDGLRSLTNIQTGEIHLHTVIQQNTFLKSQQNPEYWTEPETQVEKVNRHYSVTYKCPTCKTYSMVADHHEPISEYESKGMTISTAEDLKLKK